jgi:hypothetical protein
MPTIMVGGCSVVAENGTCTIGGSDDGGARHVVTALAELEAILKADASKVPGLGKKQKR